LDREREIRGGEGGRRDEGNEGNEEVAEAGKCGDEMTKAREKRIKG
jgi:hypothetical protein